jgi:hypothetical protein
VALPEDLLAGAVRPPLGQTLPLRSGSTEAQELVKLLASGACYGRRKPAGHHAHVITPMKPTRRTVAATPGLLIASNRL